jgi:anti-anti-sigma regulatory factor
MQRRPPPRSIVVDASTLTDADAALLDVLTRLQLTAQRLGTSIRLRNPPRQLVELLTLFGLSDVLAVEVTDANGDSVVEVNGQPEQREETRVHEEVDGGDRAT